MRIPQEQKKLVGEWLFRDKDLIIADALDNLEGKTPRQIIVELLPILFQ